MKNKINTFILMSLFILLHCTVNSQSNEQIKEAAKYTFEIYKQIHQEPELGKKEFKTSALIKKELQKIGYTKFYTVQVLPTCIIAELDTQVPGPIIALRAELDARPGKENTGLPYASKTDTTNHSCGHDAHASILLGTAKLLFKNKAALKGKIYFIFQPAEEVKGGADDIVKSGILKSLKVENIFALHSVGGMAVGTVSISPGYMLAGSNYFTISIKGKGSHAAIPYEGSNLPVLTSRMIELITAIPAIKMDISLRPCVISPTYIELGNPRALNVLTDTATVKGTIRAYEPVDEPFQGQPSIEEIITREISRLCKTQDASCTINIRKGSPPTYNDNDLFNTTIPGLKENFSGTIDTTPYKGMFSEDFSYYTQEFPCLYFGLGVAKDNLGFAGVHTNEFSVHPDAFFYGIELFLNIVKGHK